MKTAFRSLRFIVEALGRDGRRRLSGLAALTFLGTVAETASLALLGLLVGSWSQRGAMDVSHAKIGLFALAVIAAGLVRYFLLRSTQKLVHSTGHRLLVAAQRRILARDWLSYASARESGSMAVIEQVDQLVYGFLLPLLQAAIACVLALAIVIVLLMTDATAALAAAAGFVFLFAASLGLTRPVLARTGQAITDGYEERIAAVTEHHGAFREIILAQARHRAAARFEGVDQALATARSDLSIALASPRLLVETAGLLLLAGLAIWLFGHEGGLTSALPALAIFALGAQRLLPLGNAIAQGLGNVVAHRHSLDRVASLLGSADLQDEPPAEPLPFRREARLEGITFTYPSRADAAIAHMDLVVRRGEIVALAGPNGSGKSTTADILMGLLPLQTGRILVDGLALRPENIPAWQRNISHVPQAPYVVDGSLAENIAFMRDPIDKDRMEEAVASAGLKSLVASLPSELETRVGHRGILLSGGQRQRLAIARSLYAPAPLMIFDEATSNLDADSQRLFGHALLQLKKQRSAIVLIAHSDRLLNVADRVIRLHQGQIVSEDTGKLLGIPPCLEHQDRP